MFFFLKVNNGCWLEWLVFDMVKIDIRIIKLSGLFVNVWSKCFMWYK